MASIAFQKHIRISQFGRITTSEIESKIEIQNDTPFFTIVSLMNKAYICEYILKIVLKKI